MHEKIGMDFWEYMTFDELLSIVKNYPRFYISDNTMINDIEKLNEGNYIINEFPSVNLLRQFPNFMNSNGEIMLLMITDILIMNVSKTNHSYYTGELMPLLKNGKSVFLNVHSHPFQDNNINVGVPSINDLKNGNSFNKLVYIIHDKGVLEYDVSLIDNIDRDILDIMFWKFVFSDEKYKNMNIYEQESLFYDSIGLKRRHLSFEEFYIISINLLNEKGVNKRR